MCIKWQRNHIGTAADAELLVPVICTNLLWKQYAVLQVWPCGSDLERLSWACQGLLQWPSDRAHHKAS